MDNDGDGWNLKDVSQSRATCPGPGWTSSTNGEDCDDTNPEIHSCTSMIIPWFLDNDTDGYFAMVQMSSTKPITPAGNWTDVITKGPDCDDTNAAIGMDCGAVVKWYIDKDGDKWYDKDVAPIESQYAPPYGNYIRDPLGPDCDDTNKDITNHCYQFFYIDNDGDGWDSGMVADIDDNGGKYKVTSNGRDCDDTVYSADNSVCTSPPPPAIDCEITAVDVYNTFGGSKTIINSMINTINKYAKLLGINDKIELQHFLAQAALESKNFTSTEEGTKYQTKSVMSTFGKFFNGIGNENKNPNLKNLSDFGVTKSSNGKSYTQNREALFNYIYNDQNRIRVGYSPIGNTKSGDGYKFIGRGIIQITGRDNYTKFNNWYKSNVDPNADLVNNPKLLDTNKEIGTLASLWYFKERVMDRLGGITDTTTVDQVTKKVNTKMLEKKKRADNFKSAKQKINCKN